MLLINQIDESLFQCFLQTVSLPLPSVAGMMAAQAISLYVAPDSTGRNNEKQV
jgi:hypothetical protein